ncbi:hypothetical protein F5Y14DRAFT_305556 [Nemania sp. NC0429]|nr:hypothetical protein F5Y14DRAFT_305556 [Nemania sp. NC0429]
MDVRHVSCTVVLLAARLSPYSSSILIGSSTWTTWQLSSRLIFFENDDPGTLHAGSFYPSCSPLCPTPPSYRAHTFFSNTLASK